MTTDPKPGALFMPIKKVSLDELKEMYPMKDDPNPVTVSEENLAALADYYDDVMTEWGEDVRRLIAALREAEQNVKGYREGYAELLVKYEGALNKLAEIRAVVGDQPDVPRGSEQYREEMGDLLRRLHEVIGES